MYNNISEIKFKNKSAGFDFFAKETLAAFNSKILPKIIYGEYFITSEYMLNEVEKMFTIHKAYDNGSIKTVGTFQQFESESLAIMWLRENVALLDK